MIIRCAGCGANLADPSSKPREPCPECGEIVRAVVLAARPDREKLPETTRRKPGMVGLLFGRRL